MSDSADIEDLGIEMPMTREYENGKPVNFLTGGSLTERADAAIAELLAIITRLAWERGCAIGWLQSLGKHEVEEALSYAWDTSGRRPPAEEEP